jgi:large subunit ribosomal protein L25
VPAIIYSKGAEGKKFSLDATEWRTMTRQGDVNLVDLKSQDGATTKALVKDVQEDFLKNEIVHIDFMEVRMDEEITASVSIHALPGTPVGVSQGGILEQPMHEITVSCLPANLPEEGIEVDISELEIDCSLHIKELTMPEGVTAVDDPDSIVFHVMHQKAEEEEAEEAEGAEGVEGAEGAEGAPEDSEKAEGGE